MSLQFTLIAHPLISCILFVLKRSVLHIELDSDWPPPLYSHHWAEIASSGRPLPPAKVFFLVPNWIGSYTRTVKLITWVPAFTVCYHEENLSVFPANTGPFDILIWPILLPSWSFLIVTETNNESWQLNECLKYSRKILFEKLFPWSVYPAQHEVDPRVCQC